MAHSAVQLRLLGGFDLVHRGVPVADANKPRLQSLLAYLVLHAGTPQLRQHVAFLLWPDTPESNARNNLRQLLHQLRQVLPEHDRLLVVDAQTVRWQLDDGQAIDVHQFQHALAAAEAAAQAREPLGVRHWLEQAVSLYHGDLLPGCYDEWITPEREQLRQQSQQARRRLAALLEEQGAYAEAVQVVQPLVQLDPLDEDNYIRLLRLYGLSRDRQGLRRVFDNAVDVLQRELAVEPSAALRQAYAHWQRATEAQPAAVAVEAPESVALPLVGRQAEWRQLQAAWQRAQSGQAQLVLVTGEPGIGKTRLAEQLYQAVRRQGFTAAHTRSYAAEGRLTLAPVTDWLRSPALRPHWSELGPLWRTELARLLPELVSEQSGVARPEPIGEFGLRQRFFEALARAVFAAPRPILLWIDDLQWCDPETLEWLHFLLRFELRAALLVLGTARSEESPADHPLTALAQQLRANGNLVTIELAPLDAAETAQLASQIEGQALGPEAASQLYHETEGNPLFVVETMRAGLPSAFAAPATAGLPALPPRVHAVIAGRLARLSPGARRVVELAATIGRAFSLEVLVEAGTDDEASTVLALDELWQKRLVREQSTGVFDFTHDKLREVAYAGLSAPQRRFLHRHVAQALAALHAADLDPVSAQIAAHYEQAGLFAQAIPYYQRAGSVAAQVYANDDAIRSLTHARSLLSHLPAGTQRDTQELSLLLALSPLYNVTLGWASPELERILDRAVSLAITAGDAAQQAQALYCLQSVHTVQARLAKVQATHATIQALFLQTQGTVPPFANLMVAAGLFHMGQLSEAEAGLRAIVAVREERYLRSLQASQGVNYLVMGHSYHAHVLWCLGYPKAALTSAAAASDYAREYEQPFSRALAITYMALLQEWCAGPDTFLAYARDAHTLTGDCQAPYYHAWAHILVAFGEAWQRPEAAQVAGLRAAIDQFTETGAHLRLPVYYSLLARAYQRAGLTEPALAALQQALAEAEHTQEHWWDAELHRLRGELLLAQGATPAAAEGAFQQASTIAQAQQARCLELRAALSLARLWQRQGRAQAGRQLLEPLYAWFREGLETPDLAAAREFLAIP